MKPITATRRAVVTLANRLNKKIRDLSAAFVRAWQMIKAQMYIKSKVLK
jgi:hypothetical protein